MAAASFKTQLRKQQNAEFWHRVNRFIFLLIILTIGALIFLSFYPEWKRLQDLRRNSAHLKDELARKEQILNDKNREIHLLQNDPEYLEVIAREKLDMMKPDETIIRIDTRTRKTNN